MNNDQIKELLEALLDTDVTELLIENKDGTKLRIRRGALGAPPVVAQTFAQPAAAAPVVAPVAAPVAAAAPAAAPVEEGEYVTSPFVGTFYRAASPESPNYVEVGQAVKKGQVLCIVEAMKIMNEIEAEAAGKIAEVLVENGQAVEFGQRLFRIET